jgi:hypothetical protein
VSKQPASSSDPYVGRLSVNSIPPPHTATSIMRRISKVEMLEMSTRSQLFTSISSELPMGEEHVSILTSGCPGSTPEDPLAFVVESKWLTQVPAPTSASAVESVRYPPLSTEIRNHFPAFTKPMRTLRPFREFKFKSLRNCYVQSLSRNSGPWRAWFLLVKL